MGINYYEKERIFKLDTPNTTYMFCLVDKEGFMLHMYYGRRLSDYRTADLTRTRFGEAVPSNHERERCAFNDCMPFEYATHGLGDYRDDAFKVLNPDGFTATSLEYRSHRIYPGKPAIKGMPATFGKENECTTLEIVAQDPVNGLEVTLIYSAFEDVDAITRSVKIRNTGKYSNVKLTKVLSTCVDFEDDDYDTIFLHGSWARERTIDRNRLGHGKHYVSSKRGESSHQEHPFLALLGAGANEDNGEVWGFNFVYSGNFIAQAEKSQFKTVRVMMGINPEDFCWNLRSGEVFEAPEVVMVYSHEGIGRMSRTFHDLYRKHLIRSKYRDAVRPILINNWEATYFDFDTDKLISIAKEASRLGIEMLVMDDGWFGKRNSDDNSLGDWVVNENKLKGGLKYLVDEVNKLGMKFGIWMEPEMISPDSDLYRAHPDWAIHIPGRKGVQSRAQFVLDLSRPEVVDYTYEQVRRILKSANIEYLKWDMNRQITDLGSAGLDSESQGELFHRYVLGVYELQERLVTEFPDLLLENCSGGGARFDPGMLYYGPQIWCSDNADAIARLEIQQGTALMYPLSTMGAHVSDCPNHTVGRTTPFETRGYVALAGTFGYELDVTRIPEADRNMIPAQTKMYHRFSDIVRLGDYYRISSFHDNRMWDAWEVVRKDKTEAILTIVNVFTEANYKSLRVKMKGLDPEKTYRVSVFDIETGEDKEEGSLVLKGDSLMYAGINAPDGIRGDFRARLIHIVEA